MEADKKQQNNKTEVISDKDQKVFPARKIFQKNRRPIKRGGRPERIKSEFDHRILNARRVSRVTAGGKRFSLSLAVAIGNRKGKIGVATGKGLDNALALEKALRSAKKSSILVKTTKNMSIFHQVYAKYSSAEVMLRPAPNRGLVAGSAVRIILELGGLKDINAKILSGSKNKLNIAMATIKALESLKTR